MKTLIAFWILTLSIDGLCQKKLTVTIVGTAHHFAEEHQALQDFRSVEEFIDRYNPDILCIESIPIDDTLSLREIWPNTMKRAAALKDSLWQHNAVPYSALKSHDLEDPFWKVYDKREFLLKGANYFAENDYWNAYYFWFQAEKSGDSLHYFSKFQGKLQNSEYGLFVYPAAQSLGVTKLYSIDYRAGEKVFLENSQRVLKKLLFRLKWRPLKIYFKTQKNYKKAEKEGRLIEYINSDEFQNSFSNLIEELPRRLPKSKEAHQVKAYWLKRNKIMAERLIQRAEEQSAKSVLLTVGSAHITHIKRFLEEYGHEVHTYGDFLKNQNN